MKSAWRLFIEAIRFITVRKKYALAPLFLLIIVLAGSAFLLQGSAIAPLLYTLF